MKNYMNQLKTHHLRLIAAMVLVLLWGCQSGEHQQDELVKPNILWIVSEDNGPFLGAYGDEYATTPVLDSLASKSILYENAFANAPVCAPARSTIITGMYANSMGTQHMRSNYKSPQGVEFFPEYLREAGYYCTNNSKEDYNTVNQEEAWNESSNKATYRNRQPGQPFFHVQNFTVSHESSLHDSIPMDQLMHDPEEAPIPPYHPKTEAMKHDWAQYYDKVTELDGQIGELLSQLKADGLADSTIIFYYSDHGGVLGRSKRFMFESGLHIPMLLHVPEMYKDLAPQDMGTKTDRLVSFVDLAPTVLSLAGIDLPEYFQGDAFAGKSMAEPNQYAFSFRGRMDERIDMVRSVRNKEYRYVRNYHPHRIYGQYIEYLWRAPSMRSWYRAHQMDSLNEIQEQFWNTKPTEELYDINSDPHNVQNLVDDPAYLKVLEEMRQAEQQWVKGIRDVGFLPEALMLEVNQDTILYDYVRSPEFPFDTVVKAAGIATSRDINNFEELVGYLSHENPVVRYWAAIGMTIHQDQAAEVADKIMGLQDDPAVYVRIAAAEALYHLGARDAARDILAEAVKNENLMARVQAVNVMEVMGPDAKPLIPVVQEVIDRDPESREYDIRAAKRLVEHLQGMM